MSYICNLFLHEKPVAVQLLICLNEITTIRPKRPLSVGCQDSSFARISRKAADVAVSNILTLRVIINKIRVCRTSIRSSFKLWTNLRCNVPNQNFS